MTKMKIDQRPSPYSMPVALIGTVIDGKPNFMLCTWISRVNREPPVWMISINRKHYTVKGLEKNQAFSINFPPVELVKEADYCGIKSGREVDKSKLFNLFYGETNAPMIKECTFNIELVINNIIELPDHLVILSEARNSYVDEKNITDSKPDVQKMNQVIYTGGDYGYRPAGEKAADAFKIGKELAGVER
ncbi:MAG: flavin reductase family protein [Candidatus Odinarchaeota archaeon]